MEMTTNGFEKQYPKDREIYRCQTTKRAFYRVKVPELGLYYGLKEIEVSEPRQARAIKNEAIALNRLPFGVAARCHQYWKEGNKHYLLLDWIEGTPLSDLVKSIPSNQQEYAQRIKIAEKIGWKLVELHRYGVIHRDIKPENVIVHADKNGNVRDVSFIDFGLANQKRDIEEGTVQYRSPEQEYIRNANLTFASDIFSFCQVIHFLLMGSALNLQPNFDGSGWEDISVQMNNSFQKLEPVLLKGLDFNAERRPTQVFTLVKALQETSKYLNKRR